MNKTFWHLAAIFASAALGLAISLTAPAAHATPVRPVLPVRACTSTPYQDFDTFIATPGWTQGDWESSNPCNFQMQSRDHCQDYFGHSKNEYSGIVIGEEIETRAS